VYIKFIELNGQNDIMFAYSIFSMYFYMESHNSFCVQDELFGVLLGLAYSPKEVCSYVLGTDCGEPYNPNAMWNVTFPNVPKPPVVQPSLPKVNFKFPF
jgi:hypothetical protein